jgi:hypothetical protein
VARSDLFALAGADHRVSPSFGETEHFVDRSTDLGPRQQAVYFEPKFPTELICLDRAHRAQLALTLRLAQLEAEAERDGVTVPDGALQGTLAAAR